MKKSILHQLPRYLLLIFCLCLVLAACSDEEPTPEPTVAAPAPTATTAPAATPTAAQPESPLNADSPLPTPAPVSDAGAAAIAAIPAGDPVNPQTSTTTGAVTGRIFLNNDKGFRAISGLLVGLAEVIKGDDGVEKAAGYDPSTAPRGELRADGAFVIDNVPPGRYGVILDAVTTSILLKEMENPDNSLVITVEANKVTDLGNMVYPSIPLPGVDN
ncbi:MAG: hypothetical protein DYG89_23940 [Caldilinea sp. CFX5]|nr:hypothetical protein [Caldilinea sp. CFX5]